MADHGARSRASAAVALAPHWRNQVADLRFWETEVRAHRPDAVHHFRVATRRLRSTLSGFEPLLDVKTCRTLGTDLRRTAAAIGGARDSQVIRAHVEGWLDDDPDPTSVSSRDRLVRLVDDSDTESWQRSLDHLDSPDYDAFTRSLERFADLPPWGPAAGGPAEEVLRPVLRSEWSRFRRRAKDALDPEVGAAADARLHEARKAAKRARYVSESLVPVFGRKAKRLGKAAERVQVALGEYQDCVLVHAFVREAGTRNDLDADARLVLERIRESEAAAAAVHRAEFARLFHDADRKSLRSWMR